MAYQSHTSPRPAHADHARADRQPYHKPHSSIGAAGHWIKTAGILAPLVIGEFVKDADQRWRYIRLAYGRDAHEWTRLGPDEPLHLHRIFTFGGRDDEVPNINITGFAPPSILSTSDVEHVFAGGTKKENRRQLLHCCQTGDELDAAMEDWLETRKCPLKMGEPFDLGFDRTIALGNGRKVDLHVKATFEFEFAHDGEDQESPYTRLTKMTVDLDHAPARIKGVQSGQKSL